MKPLLEPQTSIRLKYLDGLRGIAALSVVIHHIHQELEWAGEIPTRVFRATKFLQLGHYAVAMFIVLSGYSLMLPVVRSANRELPGGAWAYLKRRARRILPPYYAALALTLLLFAIVPGLREPVAGWRQNTALPAFTAQAIASHLFLVHNLTASVFKINSPMWSVATEWQIYFLLPALLLPVWRRWGNLTALAVAVIAGLAPHFLWSARIDAAGPWYLGLFGFGMAAASVSFSSHPGQWRDRVPWGAVSVGFAIALAAMIKLHPGLVWVNDNLAGTAAAALLIGCARHLAREATGGVSSGRPIVLRLLETRWAVALGAFSYSLYLTHSPLISCVHLSLHRLHLSSFTEGLAVSALSLPLALALAYLFHIAFERPFLHGLHIANLRDGAVLNTATASGDEPRPIALLENPEGS
jgi:peptidoglycan/LPS O-acetylase OafA/YrhL